LKDIPFELAKILRRGANKGKNSLLSCFEDFETEKDGRPSREQTRVVRNRNKSKGKRQKSVEKTLSLESHLFGGDINHTLDRI